MNRLPQALRLDRREYRREPVPGLREGLLRAACAAVGLALVAWLVDLILYQRVFRADLMAGAGLGALAGPLAWLERQSPAVGWGRLRQAVWLGSASVVGAWAIGVQTGYTEGFLSHASWSLAMEAAGEGAWLAAFDPLTPAVLLLCALPFVALPQLRTRHRNPWLLALVNGVAVMAVAGPVLRGVDAWAARRHMVVVHTSKQLIPTWGLPSGPQASAALVDAPDFTVGRYLLLLLPLAGAMLALCYVAADVLAERWRRSVDLAPAPPLERRLTRSPWIVVPCALVLGGVLGNLSRAHPTAEQVERWIPLAERGGRTALATQVLERIDASDAALVPKLLRQASSNQSARRRWGIRLLGQVGPAARVPAEELILAAITDVDQAVAVEALYAVGRLQIRSAVEELIEIFFTGGGGLESQAAERALEALGYGWNRETVPLLLPYTEHTGYRIQRQALGLLVDMGPEAEGAFEHLLGLLAPSSDASQTQPGQPRRHLYYSDLAEAALVGIGELTFSWLRERLTDIERLPAAELARTTAVVNALGAAEPTVEVWGLLHLASVHQESELRVAAARALERQIREHGSRLPRALHADTVDMLLELAAEPSSQVGGTLSLLHSWAVPRLLERLQDPAVGKSVRPAVIKALGSMSRRNREIDRVVAAAAKSKDPASRMAAAQALGIRSGGEHELLHRLAQDDPDSEVRRMALVGVASGGRRSRKVRERLRASLDDETRKVRVEAALLLGGRTWGGSSHDWSYLDSLDSDQVDQLRPFLPRLIAVLMEGLRDPSSVTQTEYGGGAELVGELLQRLGPHAEPVVLPRLAEAVRDQELGLPMRLAAARVLANFYSGPARAMRARLFAEETIPLTVRAELGE